MPAFTYVHIVDIDLGKHVIKRMPTIKDAVAYVHNFDVFNRNIIVYAVRYDEVLALKSTVMAANTILSDRRDLLSIDEIRRKNFAKAYGKHKI